MLPGCELRYCPPKHLPFLLQRSQTRSHGGGSSEVEPKEAAGLTWDLKWDEGIEASWSWCLKRMEPEEREAAGRAGLELASPAVGSIGFSCSFSFFKFLIVERGNRREKERERNINV